MGSEMCIRDRHQAHDEPGALPEAGDQDAVDDDVGVVERVEGEALSLIHI